MNESMMVRKPIAQTAIICDWDEHDPFHRKIEKGKPIFQIRGDETIKAQGNYHSKQCYDAALAKYKELKEELDG